MAKLSLLLTLFVTGVSANVLHPVEVDFVDLQQRNNQQLSSSAADVETALGVDGLIAITNIPGFAELRSRALLGAHACMWKSDMAQTLQFPDGTTRRTLAAGSSHHGGQHPIEHGTAAECEVWDKDAAKFRNLIAASVDVFARFLDAELALSGGQQSLLESTDGQAFRSISEIVQAGDRLEHFHSYALHGHQSDEHTIDFHVDQGMFIAFTPALMMQKDGGGAAEAESQSAASSGTFVLRQADGSEVEVAFNPHTLILMAGETLRDCLHAKHPGMPLHVPMHAFRVPQTLCEGCFRLWYGMMQLPPAEAVHQESGLTFGELRQEIIAAASKDEVQSTALGCSRKLQARELQASCNSTQIYCWHRCFDYTETLNPDACEALGLSYNCTSQWDQVWLPEHGHGDFNPACTNSTSLVTPLPFVPQPSENNACSGFMDMVEDSTYANRVALIEDESYVLWNVAGGKVEVKMLHNGRAGWMAFGIQNVGAARGGMYGARVVMGQYNPESSEPLSVKEYRIHDSLSAYRHWKTPFSPSALSDTMMSVTDCFTTMTFTTDSIYGESLNVTSGSNFMIWGLTHNAYVTDDANGYAAYHSATDGAFMERYRFRGHVVVEFTPSTAVTTTAAMEETGGSVRSFLSMVVLCVLCTTCAYYTAV